MTGFCPAAIDLLSTPQPDAPDVPITMAQAFSLHSKPTATKKIFLDFDGHNTSNTAW